MSLVKVVIRESTDNNVVHEYTPLESKLTLNGRKKPDELEVTLKMKDYANSSDLISYVEDVVDLDYCSAIWNFQLNTKDERGYNYDGTDVDESRYNQSTSLKTMGNYRLRFTSTGQEITIPNSAGSYENDAGTTITNKIDLSKQFDIYIWCTPDEVPYSGGTVRPVLFSRYDGSVGIEIGLIEDSVTSGTWRVFVRIGNGSVVDRTDGTTAVAFDGTSSFTPRLIRVCRGDDNIVRMFVNGEEDETTYTVPLVAGNVPSTHSPTADIIFGANRSGTDDYKGYLNQIKIYSGTVLSEDDHFKILQTKYQPYFMTFGGTIWNKEDKTTTKIIKAQNHSKTLNGWIVTPEAITQAPISGVTRGTVGNPDANVYSAGTMIDYIKDIVNNLDSSFSVKSIATFAGSLAGNFIADGKFSDIINLLLVRTKLTFYTTARKDIIIESAIEIGTEQVTQHEFYQIDKDTNTRTAGGQGLGGTAGVRSPYIITENKLNDTILVNELTLYGNAGISANYKSVTNGDTVHSYRLNVPQIVNQTDLNEIRDNILELSNVINKGYVIKSPVKIHHVRFNHLVKVINAMLNISTDYLKVSTIEQYYPAGGTIVYVNQFPLTYFDLVKNDIKVVEGIQSEIVV